MANRYGEAALMAARQGPSTEISPVARWESAMEKLYPTSPTAKSTWSIWHWSTKRPTPSFCG
jgi:hypothetical protein